LSAGAEQSRPEASFTIAMILGWRLELQQLQKDYQLEIEYQVPDKLQLRDTANILLPAN
jgi:hypothetical protein